MFTWLETLGQDLRYGLRTLAASRGVTAVVVLSLGLGIGANSAVFSLINAVLLRTLPVPQPEQLVVLTWESAKWPPITGYSSWGGCPRNREAPESGCSLAYTTFELIRAQNRAFSGVFAVGGLGRTNVHVEGQAVFAGVDPVSGDYFSTLGVQPVLGRAFTLDDDRFDAEPVAVISSALWEQRFGRDASVVGKTLYINGAPFTVVGVAPSGFVGLQAGWSRDIWIPLAMLPRTGSFLDQAAFTQFDNWWVTIVGRLKPGINEAEARASLDVLLHQSITAARGPKVDPAKLPRIELVSVSRGLAYLRQNFSEPLLILAAVTALVLLIACVNVANLLLARSSARQREMAVRLALGAGRRRLIRQLLTESLLLAGLGGVLGIVLARWTSQLLMALVAEGGAEVVLDVSPDARVLAYTAVVSLLTGILFGLAPAFRGTRLELASTLKAAGASLRRPRWRILPVDLGESLVVSQVALSVLLLVGAGLFLRTVVNLRNVELGFDPERVLLFTASLPKVGYDGAQRARAFKTLLERTEGLPGVRAASLSQDVLLSGSMMTRDITIPGREGDAGSGEVHVLRVGPRFFETMGIRLLSGRPLEQRDTETGAPRVAVVNQSVARRLFGIENPVGQHFLWGKRGAEIEVVGLVGDAKYNELRQQAPATVYTPFALGNGTDEEASFEVRTAGDPTLLVPEVRRAAQQIAPDLLLSRIKTQTEQRDQAMAQERMFAKLVTGFGGLAVVLACVGLYGVMSYGVARRTSEIGIRMALGADAGEVRWMILRKTLLVVAVGLTVGLGAALAATRVIASNLFGVTPNDPATLVAAAALMVLVAALAGYLPARRASRVDPLVALRYE